MRLPFGLGVTFLSPLLLLAHPTDAKACGGCFVPPAPQTMSTVVTGHKMAFATSGTRTVLWDQIQYAGNPSEFSWVLPVKGDVRLEPATDAWFEALETVTNARVSPPQLNCFYRSSGGNGCACGGASSDSSFAGGSGFINENGVIVNHEGSVGPYHFVQVMGGGEALAEWLPRNGYVVPADITPVLAAYAQEGFGFIALKLQPGKLIKQMTPVRVITEGGGNTLPLRMVAAGTGAFVPITLYVIAEGRYEADGFGQGRLDASRLNWDWQTSQSNYASVMKDALAADGGKVWLTAFSYRQGFTKRDYKDIFGDGVTFRTDRGGTGSGTSTGTFTNLTDLYFAQAAANAGRSDNCSSKLISGKLATSLVVSDNCKGVAVPGVVDAGASPDAGAAPPWGTACGTAPPGTLAASTLVCDGFSDLAAAMVGMHPDTVWLTRLEANLPRESLAGDLKIKPAAMQTEVAHTFRAAVHVNPPCDLRENHPEVSLREHRSEQAGIGLLSGMGLFFARRIRRKRETKSPVR